MMNQKTLRAPCLIHGIGIHSGQRTSFSLLPAPADTGVVFRISRDKRQVDVPAHHDHVVHTSLNTGLGSEGVVVGTVEHLLAALTGLQIDNVIVLTRSHELPVMDGSAKHFVERILDVGTMAQSTPRRMIKILKEVRVEADGKSATLSPSATPRFSFVLEYNQPSIGRQSLSLDLTPQSFVDEIAPARTFGFEDELTMLRDKGMALGAGLDNAVGLSRNGEVLNKEGLRYPDELVRHKILDAIGDLSLAGYPILGAFHGEKSGHTLNEKLVRALFENPDSWEMTPGDKANQAKVI